MIERRCICRSDQEELEAVQNVLRAEKLVNLHREEAVLRCGYGCGVQLLMR
jgi:hypothetical protein